MLWGVVVGAGILLAVAGVAKLAKPAVTADAMRAAGLAVRDEVASVLGGLELLVGAAVIVWHQPLLAAAVGVCYLGFALFALGVLVRRGPNVSCGCFGQRSAPVGGEHVVVDLIVATVAFLAAAGVGDGATDLVAVIGATFVLFVLLALVPTLRTEGGPGGDRPRRVSR